MDNLTAHKGDRVRELIEERGAELVYLPSYSPDFNPIEEAFSKIKRLVRKAESRSRKALVEAIGAALSAATASDARGFFEHCGYRQAVRSYETRCSSQDIRVAQLLGEKLREPRRSLILGRELRHPTKG